MNMKRTNYPQTSQIEGYGRLKRSNR